MTSKQLFYALLALFAAGSAPAISRAQTAEKQATVKVSGEVTAPLTITISDLHQFTQTKVVRKDRDGKDHTYSGVFISDILQKAGATLGANLRGENLTKYMIAEASDGYEVIFTLAELDKEFSDNPIILADQVDGKPLPAADGPFRIIVQGDKKPARCIKQVTALRIAFAK